MQTEPEALGLALLQVSTFTLTHQVVIMIYVELQLTIINTFSFHWSTVNNT